MKIRSIVSVSGEKKSENLHEGDGPAHVEILLDKTEVVIIQGNDTVIFVNGKEIYRHMCKIS